MGRRLRPRGGWRCTLATAALMAALMATLLHPAALRASPAEVASLREQAALQARGGASTELRRTLERLLALDRSPRALNDLGLFLSDQAEFAAADALLSEAVATASLDQRGLYQANLALNLRRQWRDTDAQALLQAALRDIDTYSGPMTGWRPCNLARSRAVVLLQMSRLAERQGSLEQALAHARAAQDAAARAIELVPPQATLAERQWAAADLANAQRREVHVHIQSQQPARAEQALQRWQATAERHQLGAATLAHQSAARAMLEMSRLRYAEAAAAAEQADARYASIGFAPQHLSRVALLETRVAALWAQQRTAQGLAVLKAFDTAVPQAATEPALQMPLLRGLLALDSGQAQQAATWFAAQQVLSQALPGALAQAEAIGMRGVALWEAGGTDPTQREEARRLLSQGVDLLTEPLNAAAPDGSGLRALIRQRVVQTYVSSQLQGDAPPTPRAAALLDWVAEGSVQRAVTQAAARLTISDPAQRELVRREQDLRRALDAAHRAAGLGSVGGRRSDDDVRSSSALSPEQQQRIRALQQQWAGAAQQLRERWPDYADLAQPLPPTVEQVRSALGAGEGLLVLAHREQDTLVWLLHANRPTRSLRVALPLARTQQLVTRLRQSLEFPEQGRLRSFDRAAAGELHRLLIEPLRDELQGLNHLSVMTSGPLAGVPMAVLAPDDGKASRDADWLIRRTAISQTTSLAAWLAARRGAQAAGAVQATGSADASLSLLGWGDPDFAQRTSSAASPNTGARPQRGSLRSDLVFPALPDTRDELLAIAQALGADPGRSLILGRDATRDSVLQASRSGRLAQARIVVFATHGLKAGEFPGLDQPALVMTLPQSTSGPEGKPTPEQDPAAMAAYMLSLDDTLMLELNADWVVLSACNTAASDHDAGEALAGLARGMFYAGARSLLATHWAVESRSAAVLVSSTFKAYAGAARPGKAEALRQAMLQLMTQPGYSHPAYWAPYVVVGDGGR